MLRVEPVANAPACQLIDPPVENFILLRIWNAVVEFFTTLVNYIINAVNSGWKMVKSVIYSENIAPTTTAPPALAEKLARYRDIPQDSVGLISRSIQIYQNHLREKEEAHIASLPTGTAVPDEQRPLKTFNDEWEMMANIIDIAKATVRGYVFSNSNATAFNIPFFNQVIGRQQGRYDPPVEDPETGELLHAGGHVMIDVYQDRTVRLLALRNQFNALDDGEKEIVLNKTDFEGINEMAVSDNAKAVMNGIAEISNLLHQHNPLFNDAVRRVYGQTFQA